MDVKLSGYVMVPDEPWITSKTKAETKATARALRGVSRRLGVRLEPELVRRWKLHQEDSNVKIIDAMELWQFIKKHTKHQPSEWSELVFGKYDDTAAHIKRQAEKWAELW